MVTKSLSSKREVLLDTTQFPQAKRFITAALSGKYHVLIYGGGIRGGKSYNTVGAAVALNRIYPGSRTAIVRDSLETLRRNTLPTVQKIIPSNFVNRYNASEYSWRFRNGSNMFFFAENYSQDKQLDRWNGLEVNFFILDQAEELQLETFYKVIERAGAYVIPGDRKQPPPTILITLNPTEGWARKEIYEKYKTGTLPDNWFYLPALITDNPYIPESYKSSLLTLKHANPAKYARYVEGDWEVKDKTGSEFYDAFESFRHTRRVPYLPPLPIHVAYDFNALPYMSMLAAQVVELPGLRYQVRILDAFAGYPPNNTIGAVTKMFTDKYGANDLSVFYYGDASGNSRQPGQGSYVPFDDVRKGLLPYIHGGSNRVLKKNTNVLHRRDVMNGIFRGVDEEGRKYDVEIIIDSENCPLLIKDLNEVKTSVNGKLKEMVTDATLKARYQKNGHFSDALDYLLNGLFPGLFK